VDSLGTVPGLDDEDLFRVQYIVSQRPVVLFINRHKTRMTLDIINPCRENKIILFSLSPHTAYALQPLDVAVFKSLKDHFSKSVCALAFAKPNFVIAKRDFAKVFKGQFECVFSAMKRQALKNQEYFNPNTIATAKMLPSTLYKAPSFSSPSTPKSSGSSLCPPSPSVSSNTTMEDSVSTLSAVSPSPTVSPWCSQNGGRCTRLSEHPRATSTPVPSPVVNPFG